MKKVKLYIAISIDGYIARKDGALDWLEGIPNPDGLDYGYTDLINSVDTILMGSKTYKEVLGFDVEWPYTQCQSYILSRQADLTITTPNTHLLNGALQDEIEKLKQAEGKDIWLVGGGQVITSFLDLGLIDEMLITITPVIIGEGIPLFPGCPKETSFELVKTSTFDTGFVNLTYVKK